MNNFVVSARKYRPQTFKSVIGQLHITQTLKSAVRTNQIAHAYLFCGPRGVGKTTCARIFAKVINCFSPTEDYEPCNACESCMAFNSNRSYNIQELDAASNNSVEDIRNLIDQVRTPPRIGKYNVYIVDEVHMLSSAAFNAFLKTLEEPPSYAVFILATTEKHKILPTIISRCQVFDFNRIRIEDTINHLKYVAQSEHVTVEEPALRVIAQKAEGGMRDALSIFDQLVSFTNGNITYQNTIENLNILDCEYFFKVVDNILSSNVAELMLLFDDVLRKGFDGLTFISGLGQHFRNLLMSRNPKTVKLIDASSNLENKFIEQAQQCSIGLIYNALQKIRDCEINYKASKNQRLLVELTLLDIGFYQHNSQQKKKPAQQPEKITQTTPVVSLPPRPNTATGLKNVLTNSPENSTTLGELKTESAIKETSNENITEGGNAFLPPEVNFTAEENNLPAEIWANIIEPFQDQVRLSMALKNANPKIENQTLILSINSESQKEFLDNVKSTIIQQIQQKFNNNITNIGYHIIEKISIPIIPKPEEPKSLLQEFEQKNSHLRSFINTLDLKPKR